MAHPWSGNNLVAALAELKNVFDCERGSEITLVTVGRSARLVFASLCVVARQSDLARGMTVYEE
jgi:hypothetical protein